VNIFSLVRLWVKINNQTKINFFKFLNWTENRFEPTMFGLFFPLPNQFKPKLFQLSFFLGSFTGHIFQRFYFHLVSVFFWVFSLVIFFRDYIFILFLFLQLCAYFLWNLGFLNKHDSFLNRLGMYDIQKFNHNFLFVRFLPKN